jgi:hypothetical protein
MQTSNKLRTHTLLATLTLVIGLMLMIYMVNVESEPGAIPLLLIACGIGWHLITRARIRSLHK